jgi:hypothetical protein
MKWPQSGRANVRALVLGRVDCGALSDRTKAFGSILPLI